MSTSHSLLFAKKKSLAILVASLLAGCGGSSSSSSPVPVVLFVPIVANNKPVFTSAATASAAENQKDAKYTAKATDADGDALTYGVSGGADQAAFTINSKTGQLYFKANPDFETKASYAVELSASDGKATVNHAVTVVITDVKEIGFSTSAGTLSSAPAATPTLPVAATPTDRKLLAIYMVGSDLESGGGAGTTDFNELIAGYNALTVPMVDVVVAFGGANKAGWKGMKYATMAQIISDGADGVFGNSNDYLFVSDSANMGDKSSLDHFLAFVKEKYINATATTNISYGQKFLAMWDHGGSYGGFGNDENFNMDPLSLTEMSSSFAASGIGKWDVIGFDSCLMAAMEVVKITKDNANYLLASEELEPGHGWNWNTVITAYNSDTAKNAAIKIVDDFTDNSKYPANQVQDGKTLSVLDLSKADAVITATETLLSAIKTGLELSNVSIAQGAIFGTKATRSFGANEKAGTAVSIDLLHYGQILQKSTSDLNIQVAALNTALSNFVVHNKQDGSRPNSNGVSIDAPINEPKSAFSSTLQNLQTFIWSLFTSDTTAPTVKNEGTRVGVSGTSQKPSRAATVSNADGLVATFEDAGGVGGLEVNAAYGIKVDGYFAAIGLLEAYKTDNAGEYFAPHWDQSWFVIRYGSGTDSTAWLPVTYSDSYQVTNSQGAVTESYIYYSAEIDLIISGKNYSSGIYEQDDYGNYIDMAELELKYDEINNKIVDYKVVTYKLLYNSSEDIEPEVLYNKESLKLNAGDKVRFYSLWIDEQDPDQSYWEDSSGLLTFTQAPTFEEVELSFVDENDRPYEYFYRLVAQDMSGNTVMTNTYPTAKANQ